jgi:hypothetical protein
MYCPDCGEQNEQGARFCMKCGSDLQRSGETPAPGPAAPSAGSAPGCGSDVSDPSRMNASPYMHAEHPYKKLGGWLMFFVVCYFLGALGSLLSLIPSIGMMSAFGYILPGGIAGLLVFVFVITFGFSIAIGIILPVMIIRRDKRFLFVYHIGSLITIALSLLVTIILGIALAGYGTGSMLIPSMAGTVAGVIIMTLYYCKSVRVRTYMGTDAYIKENPFTRNLTPPMPAA